MNDFDFVFSEEQYKLLSAKYDKILCPDLTGPANSLGNAITLLENNNFQMPLDLQNKVLNQLLQAQQLLQILFPQKPTPSPNTAPNNPFYLISILGQSSVNLRNPAMNTPYQIIAAKFNSTILDSINNIAKYFKNKQIKIFKHI